MIITHRSLPRRTVLRGLGTALALPLLDSMTPALAGAGAGTPARRFGAVYVGMGVNPAVWAQPAQGPLQMNPILAPVAAFKDRLLVVSGLASKASEGRDAGVHPRPQTAWLTGCLAKATEGADIHAGTSLDQIVGREFGKETQFASLELATEATELAVNACAPGYSCTYQNTISWRTPTSPMPMENNPRAVFERLFGDNDSTSQRLLLRELQADRSVLDEVTQKVARLQRTLGPADKLRLSEYLEAVRDVERRLQRAQEQTDRELPLVDRPVGIPPTFEEHVKLMYDLQALAFQTDLTRVFTFLVVREASVRGFPEIGVPEAYHPVSHHGNDPEKLAKQAKINSYTMKLFAYFLEKLERTPDGDGSLLDHTLLLYGSGMSNSSMHLARDLPIVVVGGGRTFGLTGGRHLRFPDEPLANLELTLADRLGVSIPTLGDSTGRISLS